MLFRSQMENSYQLTGRPCGLYPFSGSCLFSPVRLCVCYCSLLSSRSAWALQDLNLGPTDYESAALTAELRAREEREYNAECGMWSAEW